MSGAATSVYLPDDLKAKVARLADAQGRSASSVVVEAVRLKFARKDEPAEGITIRHLARLEARVDKAVRDGALIKETVLLFVRVWLEHNPPIEEHLEESAAASASARFERFLDYVANSIDSGRSLAAFDVHAPADGAQVNGAAS
ncbi:MAG: ribbon-helix-helix protein, CopG family [Hyphomonadaceae bacterium]|nr:ribbon-helix-helix protein, CopG family [Hyphomonadaceae bacterium]